MRTLVFAVWFLATVIPTPGQIISDWQIQTGHFQGRVKNIEFFIDRFNNQPEGSGKIVFDSTDSVRWSEFRNVRSHQVFALFDEAGLDRNDKILQQRLYDFFSQVNDPRHPQFIPFNDADWYAHIDFAARQKGKKGNLACTLQATQSSSGIAAWTIRSFISDSFHLQEHVDSLFLFDPSVHGTDFMDVRLKLQDPGWIAAQFKSDSTSGVLRQLRSKELVIDNVEKITFYFLAIDGWLFTVEYVYRNSANSGWLIKQLIPLSEKEKVEFLQTRLIR